MITSALEQLSIDNRQGFILSNITYKIKIWKVACLDAQERIYSPIFCKRVDNLLKILIINIDKRSGAPLTQAFVI